MAKPRYEVRNTVQYGRAVLMKEFATRAAADRYADRLNRRNVRNSGGFAYVVEVARG